MSVDMNASGSVKLLEIHPDTVACVRAMYGLDEERLRESLDQLEEWVDKQPHFTSKDLGRGYIERMLLAAKGSVERTKKRIDQVCTLKNLLPQYFEDFDAKERLKDHFGKMEFFPLRKLTKDHKRYLMHSLYGSELTSEMFFNMYKFGVMVLQYGMTYDYAAGYEVILDFTHAKMSQVILTFGVLNLRDLATVAIEAYGLRVAGIHLILDSTFIDAVLQISKQIIPKKLRDRIHTYKNMEELHKVVEKDLLPEDFGGKEKSSHDLFGEWVETISSQEFRSEWRRVISARTDEAKRTEGSFQQQYMGMPGSFRTLTVD